VPNYNGVKTISTCQTCWANLDLASEDDYWVVLCTAEKLCPGIYCKVENPDTFIDRVHDFFSGFGGGL